MLHGTLGIIEYIDYSSKSYGLDLSLIFYHLQRTTVSQPAYSFRVRMTLAGVLGAW